MCGKDWTVQAFFAYIVQSFLQLCQCEKKGKGIYFSFFYSFSFLYCIQWNIDWTTHVIPPKKTPMWIFLYSICIRLVIVAFFTAHIHFCVLFIFCLVQLNRTHPFFLIHFQFYFEDPTGSIHTFYSVTFLRICWCISFIFMEPPVYFQLYDVLGVKLKYPVGSMIGPVVKW